MNKTGKKTGDRCDPAASIIRKFGGVRPLARALGLNPSALTKWQRRQKGMSGLIPAKYHWSLLALARVKHIRLTAADLIGKR